jgi:phosphatidyl-myo-inositol dimannoside synthase
MSVDVRRLPLSLPEWGVRSGAGLRGYWRALAAVRRVVRSEGIAEVHCGRNLPEGWIAWLLRRWSGIPYVCYVHGEELNTAGGSRELAWMTRRVFGAARLVIANSRNTARILKDEWRIEEARLRVLHPGVDTERFTPAARDARVRGELGWGERPVILTVGRLQKRKGHDMLLRALPAIRERAPDVLYAIVGDGEERARLERLAAELDLSPHVQFRGEPDDAELIRCYQQCDLFALPNREVDGDFEGFGMVLVEAQACGKPVLAGASGGTAETMRIPETGVTVNCDGPERLAETVSELLADPAAARADGPAGAGVGGRAVRLGFAGEASAGSGGDGSRGSGVRCQGSGVRVRSQLC